MTYRSGNSRRISRCQVLSFHQSAISITRSQIVSSFKWYISYRGPKILPCSLRIGLTASLLATSRAALLSPFNTSMSSLRSGKKRRDSMDARTASAARKRNASPSKRNTSHIREQASRGRWSKNSGRSQSKRYSDGDIWCCLKLK